MLKVLLPLICLLILLSLFSLTSKRAALAMAAPQPFVASEGCDGQPLPATVNSPSDQSGKLSSAVESRAESKSGAQASLVSDRTKMLVGECRVATVAAKCKTNSDCGAVGQCLEGTCAQH